MRHLSIILTFCIAGFSHAQTLVPEPEPDEVPESLLENEFDDPFSFDVSEVKEDKSKKEITEVPGERPEIQGTPDEGISIQVEKSAASNGKVVPRGEVKVYSPWPAKPMFPAPDGWKFAPAPAGMTPYRTEAQLSTGQKVSLSITPFVLVPITDGESSIRITEPGYNAELGYVQRETVAAIVKKSNADLEQNEQEVAGSIRRLQQLLSSLPKPTAGNGESPSAPEATQP